MQQNETWLIRRTQKDLDRLGEIESIFALGNGWVGWRGILDEGEPVEMPGSYLSGFHEQRELAYPENGYGFPQRSDTVVSAPNAALIRLWVAGEPLDVRTGTVRTHEQVLDLRAGVLRRHTEWVSPAGHAVRIRSTRLVSLPRRAVAAVHHEVEPLGDDPVELRLCSDVQANERIPERSDDPRAATIIHDPLIPELHRSDDCSGVLVHRTERSGQRVAVAVTHRIAVPDGLTSRGDSTDDRLRTCVEGRIRPGDRLRITKFAAYECAPVDGTPPADLAALVAGEAADARKHGFDALLADQRATLDALWQTADVELDGDPELQQAVRFAVFHLLQAGRADGDRTIPAKGLTGNGYDGHVLWDTESYVLSVLTYLAPEVTRAALRWRHAHLPEARERARELKLPGAAFPWRTIGGRECSGYWPAGTAALHVNADIADAVLRYVAATGDERFLVEAGLELLVETARLWHGFGHWSDDGAFHVTGVTGPDEYAALVDDNLFTNLMVRHTLRGAADAAERHPERAVELGVEAAEIAGWRAAADAVAIPYDPKRGVHQQSAGFTTQPEWDFAALGDDDYPLLLNFPYLELYRKQVVKQADLVLAMQRCPGDFTAEEKARNFAYYEARTVRDSSLSAGPQAVLAAELGHLDLAYDLFAEAALHDLADLGDKTSDGLHLAALAGAWTAVVEGFGGLRDDRGELSFDPRLPTRIHRLAFGLRWRGQRLRVTLTPGEARYELPDDPDGEVTLRHAGEPVTVTGTAPVTLPMPPVPDFGPEPPSPPGRRPQRRSAG
ncbi:glycoside hydrolase family 65 protein [Micromonospora sp. KC721]|uniref:glycoside hydrolase family 65 protein n=1 Tax=Micromonospora sp. KC721 TaxID=2530380 RepID=UPI0010435E43|nr:glycosyl hydrolase family 65 protein [Micromonospora sp. KC721]TDB81542.1 glycoside hydrolase family 65 protein [Micromonospora sp. KC721]